LSKAVKKRKSFYLFDAIIIHGTFNIPVRDIWAAKYQHLVRGGLHYYLCSDQYCFDQAGKTFDW